MSQQPNPTTLIADPGTPFLEMTREFDAPPALVYRAHAEPELVERWLGPRELATKIDVYDVRTGGSYRYRNIDGAGNEYGFRGIFHEATPGSRIVQTFEFDGAPGQVALEFADFEDIGGGRCRLRTRTVFGSVEGRDGALASGMESGMEDSMARLDEVLENLR